MSWQRLACHELLCATLKLSIEMKELLYKHAEDEVCRDGEVYGGSFEQDPSDHGDKVVCTNHGIKQPCLKGHAGHCDEKEQRCDSEK